MNPREKVKKVFAHCNTSGAMWTGHPNEETVSIYARKWGIEESAEAVYGYLQDDCRWFMADGAYKHPLGAKADGTHRPVFDTGGCFADAETMQEIERYPWPDVQCLDFSETYRQIEQHLDKMVFTGMWSPFFHIVADFFGMENYFIKMHEQPKIVHAVTERVVEYYVRANELFFGGIGTRADVMFFGNDFGTQLDLLISPEIFREFILPYLKRIIEVGKKHEKLVMMHSCGSIHRIIPTLIDAGVDILHPLQAQAAGMDAQSLRQYKNDLAFVGGIDAQSFFVHATPQQIADEVHRVRDILGPGIVISPSHEEILPNVPPENLLAMAKAARD